MEKHVVLQLDSPQAWGPLTLAGAIHHQGSLLTKRPCRQKHLHRHTWLFAVQFLRPDEG